MMFPVDDAGMASGLLCGLLFGYALESAGFADPKKLTGQFRLTDFSVFKVMFTAVLFAAFGLSILKSLGYLDLNAIYLPPTAFMATFIGGCLVGAGFAIGGYCPGTGVAACATGRLDAWFFFAGLAAGAIVYAFAIPDSLLSSLKEMHDSGVAQRLPAALGMQSDWVSLSLLAVVAGFGFWAAPKSRTGNAYKTKFGFSDFLINKIFNFIKQTASPFVLGGTSATDDMCEHRSFGTTVSSYDDTRATSRLCNGRNAKHEVLRARLS